MKRRQEYPCRRFMSFSMGLGCCWGWRGRLLFRPCGSGLFGPNADGRAFARARRIRRLWRVCAAPVRLSPYREHSGNRLPPHGACSRRRAGIRAFRGCRMPNRRSSCRLGGGEAVVRFGLCRHGCCSIGVVAGIRKFPASHRFFAQRLLRCPMCFAGDGALRDDCGDDAAARGAVTNSQR